MLNLLILTAALSWFGGLHHLTNCYFAAYNRDLCASMPGKRPVPVECAGSPYFYISIACGHSIYRVYVLPHEPQARGESELLMPNGSQLRHVRVLLDRYLRGKSTHYRVRIIFSHTSAPTHSLTDADSLKLL